MEIPTEIFTFFISMVPIIDIRFGIPIGISMGLSPFSAFFWGVAGNISFTLACMYLFKPGENYLMKCSKFTKKWLTKLFHTTREKHKEGVQKYGPFFITMFVAIPIPGSGGLPGALAGYVFGIPFWKNFRYTTAGILIAGVLISLGFKSVEALATAFF